MHSHGGVHEDEAHIRLADHPVGAKRRVVFDRFAYPRVPAEPRRIHEDEFLTVVPEGGVDRISSRPRHVAHDGPLLPEETVHEG